MTITIELPADTEKKLLAQAAASGQDVKALVVQAVEEKLRMAQLTFDQILAPIQENFRTSGMSAAELDSLLEDTLAEVRTERRAKSSKPS
jgi:hypothetical protein